MKNGRLLPCPYPTKLYFMKENFQIWKFGGRVQPCKAKNQARDKDKGRGIAT
jgi:hypothetical protein